MILLVYYKRKSILSAWYIRGSSLYSIYARKSITIGGDRNMQRTDVIY